jgi:hypothetical protein
VWDDILGIALISFNRAFEIGIFSLTATKKSKVGFADREKVREVFGIEMKSLEDMVVDVAGQYLEHLPQMT